MLEIEVALARWKDCFEDAPINQTPSVWVGHFYDTTLAGSLFGSNVEDEIGLAFICATPFGTSDPTDTFIVRMRSWKLLVSHMAENGRSTVITDYEVPYSLDDNGKVSFGMAEAMWAEPRIREACDQLSDRRRGGGRKWEFEQSFHAAAKWGLIHEGH